MNKKVKLFDIPIDPITMEETVNEVILAIQERRQIHHTVVNAGKIVLMQNDRQLFHSVVNSDIINADGQSVVWASKLLGKPLPERVAGIDLMERLVEVAHRQNFGIFFLGAKEEVVKNVAEIYAKIYSPSVVAGYYHGYFKEEEDSVIAEKISRSGAKILFVAISSPRKENFLFQNKEKLNSVNFIMGVGGSFDVVAGITKRAPLWVQKLGMEWFYRFMQEPLRMWNRYTIGNLKFIMLVIKEMFQTTK